MEKDGKAIIWNKKALLFRGKRGVLGHKEPINPPLYPQPPTLLYLCLSHPGERAAELVGIRHTTRLTAAFLYYIMIEKAMYKNN